MSTLIFITHPEVAVDPETPIERWHLSATGTDRMRVFSRSPVASNVRAIWSSTETKAIEAAGILAGALGLGIRVSKDLGENDRSSTGFLPPSEFENVADAFFAAPDVSIRGRERAIDAQARVKQAVLKIVAEHTGGDLAIVAHGAVGTLLFCALSGQAIARSFDQPFQGHYWIAALSDLKPERVGCRLRLALEGPLIVRDESRRPTRNHLQIDRGAAPNQTSNRGNHGRSARRPFRLLWRREINPPI